MKKKKSLVKSERMYPERAADVPVTQSMLYEVRGELKADISALDRKMDARFLSMEARFEARFNDIDARFLSMEARFEGRFNDIDARLDSMDAKFSEIHSRLSSMDAQIHRIALLVEEQNAKNNIVLDGLSNLFTRQERVERRVSEVEDFVRDLPKLLRP